MVALGRRHRLCLLASLKRRTAKSAAVPVEAAKVTAAPLSEQVTAIGTLLSDEAVTVSSEIPGRLKEIHFQEGQPVEKGAPLFTLDDSVYRAQLDDAEAKLKLAEQTNKRTSTLFSNKYATAQSADEAASNLAVSTAATELARVQLEKTRIVAPFSGIVGLRHVSVGEYITAGQALVNLEAIDPVKADFRVPEKFLPAIRVGQTIRIKVDAFPDATFEGKVYAIDPRLDVAGRSLLVRALVPNHDQRLRPGLFARVTVLLQLKEDALTVPEAGDRAPRRQPVCVQDRRRQGEADQGHDRHAPRGTRRDRRGTRRGRSGGDRGPAQDPRRQRRLRRRRHRSVSP